MDKIMYGIGIILTAVAIVCLFGLLVSAPVMWLWNGCLVGAIDGVRPISWLQSWGILILFGTLFKTHVTSNKSGD